MNAFLCLSTDCFVIQSIQFVIEGSSPHRYIIVEGDDVPQIIHLQSCPLLFSQAYPPVRLGMDFSDAFHDAGELGEKDEERPRFLYPLPRGN